MFGTEYTADSQLSQQRDIRYHEVPAGVQDAHSDHLHTTVHIDHFSFADLDEVTLQNGNVLELAKCILAQLPLQLPHGAVDRGQHVATLGTVLP